MQTGVPLIAVCAVDTVAMWIFFKDIVPGNHSKHSRMGADDYLPYHMLAHDRQGFLNSVVQVYCQDQACHYFSEPDLAGFFRVISA